MKEETARFRFSSFDTTALSELIVERVTTGPLLAPVTCIVGIDSNVRKWPENRSFVSLTRIADEGYLLQLSHFTEVLVIEVTDRHHIPKALGWHEPQFYGGINIPSWHKLVNKPQPADLVQAISSAFDDLMVTYSHQEESNENFYLLVPDNNCSVDEEDLIANNPGNLHKLEAKQFANLASAKRRFTDPSRKEYLKITADDWDDEIGYLPNYAALNNHRGQPLVLFKVDVHLFGEPENLRIWNGKRFTTAGQLAKKLCSERTAKRKNFELISSHLVQSIWPSALEKEQK